MELKQGTLLQNGKYRIEQVLGQGGFGITYMAEQVKLRRKVAIKEFFMKEYCERDGDTSSVSMGTSGSKELVSKFRQKFVKEAENIASFNHNHIIRIYDVFEENNTAYYVMEYLDCGSLSDYLNCRGRLSEEEAIAFIRQIADALAYIHKRKVNHLDVKPGNILLDEKNNAVLIDFGLSKHYDSGGNQTSSTPVGISKGYAPIEQYKQGGVSQFSPETDIYSLGATFYKLVTGETPSEADDIYENGLKFPDGIRLSANVKDAILSAMQPRRKDRPQSIEKFLSILDGAVSDEEVEITVIDDPAPKPKPTPKPDPNPEPTPKPNKMWKVLLLAMVLIGVIGGYYVVEGIQDRKAEQVRLEQERKERERKESEELAAAERESKAAEVQKDKREYLGYIGEGDKFLSNKQYSSAINNYEIAQTYEARYKGTEYGKEFNKGAENKINASRQAQKTYAAEQARLERERKEKEAAEQQARLERERKERERKVKHEVNGVEFYMIKVEGGTFRMGATSEQGSDVDDDEKPVHSVTLSDYYIGETEVTQELWEAVMGSNPSYFKGAQRPVENVSWNDCQEFIRKLNALTGKNFRLPTEAEWEYAARGGNKSKGYIYSGSNTIGNVAWYDDNSSSQTHNVKSKSPNELGIYDMSGNVYEWCQDWYGDYSSSSQTNPKGLSSGSYRVLRGGSWFNSAGYCRVSNRLLSRLQGLQLRFALVFFLVNTYIRNCLKLKKKSKNIK